MEKIKIYNKQYSQKEILDIVSSKGIILKDGSRSNVKMVEFNGKRIVVKVPTEKNRRKWQRFLSLFRKAEAKANLDSMETLRNNGIKTNEPIAVIENRKYGMVIDSTAIYSYLDGEIAGEKSAESVIIILKKIHKLGFLHGDSQMRNFISENNEVAVIDTNLKRKKMFKISENMEYIKFADEVPEAFKYVEKTVSFKIARFFDNFMRAKRSFRRKMKGIKE